jgi:hypothetical protein
LIGNDSFICALIRKNLTKRIRVEREEYGGQTKYDPERPVPQNERNPLGAGNFSNRFDPEIATARRGAATTKTPSAMQAALTNRFIPSAELIHMLAHIETFCGRRKHVALASNPDI